MEQITREVSGKNQDCKIKTITSYFLTITLSLKIPVYKSWKLKWFTSLCHQKDQESLQSSSSKQANSFKILIPFSNKVINQQAFLQTKLLYKKSEVYGSIGNTLQTLWKEHQKTHRKEKNTLKNLGLHTKFHILTSRAIQDLSRMLYL